MTYKELENFTFEELSHLRYSDISLDKFELLRKYNSNELSLPKNVLDKLLILCKPCIEEYEKFYKVKFDFWSYVKNGVTLTQFLLNLLKLNKEFAPTVKEIVEIVCHYIS